MEIVLEKRGIGRKPGRIRDEIMKTAVCRIRFEGKGC